MRWIQTSLIGTLGTLETFAHVLNWRHSTTADAPVSTDECRAFAAIVRDKWALTWVGANPAGPTMQSQFKDTTKYTEVRSAVLNQTGPGPWVSYGAGAAQTQHPGEIPDWEVPTQVTAFVPPLVGSDNGLQAPYQVTMCISHNTNFRGPRFRGRTYLPPMTNVAFTSAGLFNGAAALAMGQAFGRFIESVEQATDYELHVVSKKFCTSAKVIGTRVGVVPDTQRRRRRNLLELPAQAYGAPVGSA